MIIFRVYANLPEVMYFYSKIANQNGTTWSMFTRVVYAKKYIHPMYITYFYTYIFIIDIFTYILHTVYLYTYISHHIFRSVT
jgi:hypothetical protein